MNRMKTTVMMKTKRMMRMKVSGGGDACALSDSAHACAPRALLLSTLLYQREQVALQHSTQTLQPRSCALTLAVSKTSTVKKGKKSENRQKQTQNNSQSALVVHFFSPALSLHNLISTPTHPLFPPSTARQMDLLSASGESHRRCLPSDLPSPTPASPEPSTTDDSDDDGLTVRAPLTLDDDGDIPLDIPVSTTSASTTPQEQQHQHQQQQEQHRWRRRRRALLGVGGVLAVLTLVCCIARSTAARRAVTAVLQYIQRDAPPALGALLFVALDVVCIVLMLPGTPLNLAAGLIFGFARGTAVSVTGITLGAVAGFLLGRTVLRRWAERRARENPTVRAALDAVGESAFTMVFLLRLSPVMPFPLLSYVLGATPTLSFTTYTLATFLGLVPSLFTFLFLISLLSRSRLCVCFSLSPFRMGQQQ